jgi:hypothetical protein
VGRYGAETFDFASCLTSGADAASALVTTTFATARHRLRLGIRPERVEPWLLSIAHGLAVGPSSGAVVSLPAADGAGERAALARRWAETLTPRDYALVDLDVRRGLTLRELGSLVGSGQQAVRDRLDRLASDLEDFVAYELVVRRRSRCLVLLGLLDRVRGAETADVRRAVRLHARQCGVCGALPRGPSPALAALAELPAWPLSDERQAAILEAVEAGVTAPAAARRRTAEAPPAPGGPRWGTLGVTAAACAAAAALVVVVADPFGDDGSSGERTAQPGSPRLDPPVSVFLPPLAGGQQTTGAGDETETPEPQQGAPAKKPATKPAKPQAEQPPPAQQPPAQQPPPPSTSKPPPATSKPGKTSAPPAGAGKGAQAPEQPSSAPPPSTPAEPATPPAEPVRTLAWAPVPGAVAYEIVLIRDGKQIYKDRTKQARTTIPDSWRNKGRIVELDAGYYRWVVWPIIKGQGKAAKAVVVSNVHFD